MSMPFAFKIRRNARGAKTGSHVAPGGPSSQGPTPAQPVSQIRATKLVATNVQALTTSIAQTQAYVLPITDIVGINLACSLSITTVASESTWDGASIIQHVELIDPSGVIRCKINGGTYLYDHLVRFSPRGYYSAATTPPANSIAATATSANFTLRIPGLRLPRSASGTPWKIELYLNTLASLGTTAPSAVTTTINIYAQFGDAGGVVSRFTYQTIGSLASGLNQLTQFSIPVGVPIVEVFFRGNSLTNIADYFQINTLGTTIAPYETTQSILSRNAVDFGGALQANTLLLDESTQFVLDASADFALNLSGSVSNEEIDWAWLEAPQYS